MIEETNKDAERRMGKSIEALATELSKIRTGRANPSLLDHIRVEYYGSEVPLNNVANIAIEDSRTLTVTAYEKDMTPVIEKAIMKSDLGITPNSAGTVIRIPLPALTEERRRDLVKLVKSEAENGRIAIRNIRRDANGDLKDMVKEKMISEDDEHRAADQIQKLTDDYIAKIDVMVSEKEKELLEI
ncbi:MAG TPA: ribosome recycling factor [Gammaproteobacteria bacterium]|jgi:ribosome recycling factor